MIWTLFLYFLQKSNPFSSRPGVLSNQLYTKISAWYTDLKPVKSLREWVRLHVSTDYIEKFLLSLLLLMVHVRSSIFSYIMALIARVDKFQWCETISTHWQDFYIYWRVSTPNVKNKQCWKLYNWYREISVTAPTCVNNIGRFSSSFVIHARLGLWYLLKF